MKQKLKRNQRYFKDVDISRSEWVMNPIGTNSDSGLTTCAQEQLMSLVQFVERQI